jgi:peptidase M23-like protein/SH3 domain-containing protein
MTEFKLRWPTDYYIVTQKFGVNPQNYAKYGLPGHEGLDIKAPYGTNVYACADGVVYQYYWSKTYGWNIRIDHENGYKTIYAHLQKSVVRVGDRVREGQLIGYADSTGNSTGSHLHLTLKKNGATVSGETNYPLDIIDPTPYLYFILHRVPVQVKVTAHALNVRSGAGLEYAKVGLVYQGTILESLEDNEITKQKLLVSEWLNIRYGTITGWCYTQYLQEVK